MESNESITWFAVDTPNTSVFVPLFAALKGGPEEGEERGEGLGEGLGEAQGEAQEEVEAAMFNTTRKTGKTRGRRKTGTW